MPHTPGPWRKVEGRNVGDWNIETLDEFPRLIGIVRGSGRFELAERELANATLLAATPELLAACEELVNMFEGLARSVLRDRYIQSDAERRARALLARAEGKE